MTHILITNDDGFTAPGLLALRRALDPLGTITVIAPSRNYSVSGHRKTLHKPLRLDSATLADGSPGFVCSGAPADCVALALLGFIKEKVDLVVSGINPHPNVGQDITYSGTVTCALEAVVNGVPGIAVSLDSTNGAIYETAGQVALGVAREVLAGGAPPGVVLNVNVPAGKLRGVQITRQGQRIYRDQLVERLDPRGKPYYWIGGEFPGGVHDDPGTDFWALANGYVSITPLHLDLTAHARLEDLRARTWL